MNEKKFIDSIFQVGEQVKGSKLTQLEKSNIIDDYNKSKAGTAAKKAQEAIERTLNKKIYRVLIEKSASSSLDNLDDLLAQMNAEAGKWDNEK